MECAKLTRSNNVIHAVIATIGCCVTAYWKTSKYQLSLADIFQLHLLGHIACLSERRLVKKVVAQSTSA